MNICIISSYPLFPPHGGNRARTLTIVNLLQESGHHVAYVLLPSRQIGLYDYPAHVACFGASFYVLDRSPIGEFVYLLSRLAKKFLRSVAGFLSGTVRRHGGVDEIFFRPFLPQIADIYETERPDVSIVNYVHFSQALAVSPSGTLKVIDTLDSLEREMSREQQAFGFKRADVVIAIQDDEADGFRRSLGSQSSIVKTVSHIVELSEPVQTTTCTGASFIGSSFVANNEALIYFIKTVLPLIVEQEPEFLLTVSGSICSALPEHPSVRKLGRVDCVADAFASAPISINPIREGTGVNIKLLDAMALGVPTVSTTFGARGIGQEYLGGVLQAPDGDPEAFAHHVLRLYRDADLRARFGADAKRSAEAWRCRQVTALHDILALAPIASDLKLP
jgi:glycosyltransferase involved in cell wall biosynthesis